jgi:hypothetical protein
MDECTSLEEDGGGLLSQETQEEQAPATFPSWFRTYWLETSSLLVFLAVCLAIWMLGGCFDSTDNDDLIPDENRKAVGAARCALRLAHHRRSLP